MIRFVLTFVLLFLPACGTFPSQAEPGAGQDVPEAKSPLTPGIYTGEITCETQESTSGFTETQSATDIVVIGPNGLPVEDGREVRSGTIIIDEFLGFETSKEIDSVFVSTDGVIVDSHATAVLSDSDIPGAVIFVFTDTYRLIDTNTLRLTSSALLTIAAEGESVNILGSCDGILER